MAAFRYRDSHARPGMAFPGTPGLVRPRAERGPAEPNPAVATATRRHDTPAGWLL